MLDFIIEIGILSGPVALETEQMSDIYLLTSSCVQGFRTMFYILSNIYIKSVQFVSYFDRVSTFLPIFYDFVNIGRGLFRYIN